MDEIIAYIGERYDPLAVIVYGSCADGSNGPDSDFDALVITDVYGPEHDTSVVRGVQLDVFVYPRAHFAGEYDPDEVVQIRGGRAVLDTDGMGEQLIRRAEEYWDSLPLPTPEEVRADAAWCRKMLLRAGRGDAEGMFRMHWLLTDSLEIFCRAAGRRYDGPKKSLRWMEREWPEEFAAYRRALAGDGGASLAAWVECIERLL